MKFNPLHLKLTTTEKVVLVASSVAIVGSAIVLRREYTEMIETVATNGVHNWVNELASKNMDVLVLPRELTNKMVTAGLISQVPTPTAA